MIFAGRPAPAATIDICSELAASAEAVWRRVCMPEGVNEELWPFQMTFPRGLASIEEAPLGENLFRSRVTLFGLLPLDSHRMGLAALERGRSFHEVSQSLWMARWVHIRTVTPRGENCTLSDHVEFTTRLRLLTPLVAPLYRRIFARRHAVLRRRFGEVSDG